MKRRRIKRAKCDRTSFQDGFWRIFSMITVQPQLILCSLILLSSTPAYSQINPDNTLGAESSLITPNVPINGANADRIDGGAVRGSNLFHSFTQFNINDGQRVYFGNPAGVQNILTRVTGGQGSNILGTLGVNGNANLFLINPNGIVFGQNAQLNIRGAFTATTANSLVFPNGVEFSATNPQAPPLLAINVPIGLQFGSQPASITNQAVNGLGVIGSTLALVGGEIILDGGILFAFDGQVKLGSVAGNTTVGLDVNDSSLNFNYPENLQRESINLNNRSFILAIGNSESELFGGDIKLNNSFMFGSNGGSIVIDATQLSLDQKSSIQSAITGAANGGDIQIQASDAVTLANGSSILSTNNPSATGTGGDVTINAGKITITGDGILQNTGLTSFISVNTTGAGNGGNLNLNATESVNVNGGAVSVISAGVGKAGNFTVRSKDAVNITDKAILGLSSLSSGSTGNLRIETGTLRVQNTSPEGGITANTSAGTVGSISIQARNAVEVTNGSILTGVQPGSTSQASVGDITIETQRVSLKDGGYISTSTFSSANAGNIFIQADESVEIGGVSATFLNLSGVSSQTGFEAKGNGGNVTIQTPRLSLTQGGNISTDSTSSSNPGDITIRAKDLELDGFVFVPQEQLISLDYPTVQAVLSKPLAQETLSRFGGFSFISRISSEVNGSNVDVNGGTITIDTERLRLSNGANISTSVLLGRGQGGNLLVRATDAIDISGFGPQRIDNSFAPSGLFADLQIGGIGSGGNIDVTTGRLNLSNQGQISATTFNQGNAGKITINAKQINMGGSSNIITQVDNVATGDAGNISIKTQLLNVQEQSQISSGTQGNGNAGNLTVQADNIILTGSDSELITGLITSVDERANGKGGEIDITTNRLVVRDDAEIFSGSTGNGDAENMRIKANLVEINGQGSAIASLTNAGNGGDIILEIGDLLLLRRGGLISTTAGRAQAGGNGGNININSPFIVAIPNENSDISANAFTGKGGNVSLSTQAIFGIEPRPQLTNQSDITASSELGLQGQIIFTQPQVQPPQKLIELPTGLVDASTKFAQICPNGRNAKPLGSFVITGRGSLPPNSFEPLTGTTSLSPLASLDGESFSNISNASPTANLPDTSRIIEAQGFVKTADGKIMLVAQAPTATPAATSSSAVCPGS
ncbi:two-partner secretion domain-containing protein [Tolypothrix sp. PCC 7601]|uniref:two-partner secretion domain-containing protein n=1 Tax=Tolypothrix sp. PCC 7601 TaxID=1188 RepID=UPI001F3B66F8|nr:filamentous hemagglutinin N-terminal domain-containing protein [Tolypothrix sp. PCC 7601]